MLVVAKGTLIDYSEIYSAVADCKNKKGGSREVIIEDFTTDG